MSDEPSKPAEQPSGAPGQPAATEQAAGAAASAQPAGTAADLPASAAAAQPASTATEQLATSQTAPPQLSVLGAFADKLVKVFLGLMVTAVFMLIVGLVVVATLSVPDIATKAPAFLDRVTSMFGSPAAPDQAAPEVSPGAQGPAPGAAGPEAEPPTLSYVILKQLERDGRLNDAGRKMLADAEIERARQALAKQVESAYRAGKFGDALKLQEQLAAETERFETQSDGQAGEQTAGAYASLAWYALLSRAFDKALAASERALTLAPNLRPALVNRAHALLFLGRTREARAAYLENKGQEEDGKKWEDVVIADFAELRKAGVVNPATTRIEAELRK
jgi:hypothetical protein